MKKFLLLILSFSISTFAIAQDGLPGTWNQDTAYSSGSLVISNGSTYLAQQSVPSGTGLTSTAYWLSLDSAVPTSTPGSAPTTTPNVSSAPTTTPASDADTGSDINDTTPSTFEPGLRRDGSQMDSSIPDHFDVDGYYDRNHDVRDLFQSLPNDDVEAWNHYLNYGMYEDRMFDNDFVPLEYLNIYPDLKVAFTDADRVIDLNKTVYHWFDYGRAESRLGRFQMPSWFDAASYMDTHHDVRDALDDNSSFGKDTEAWWHFYRIGAPTEGRSFNDTQFNLDAYIASNPDLKEIFKKNDGTYDKKSAMYHYISDGHKEGRVDSFSVPIWFNVNEYRTNNPDVAGSSVWNTSDFLIFNHFYRFGAPGENRPLSNFNLTKYIELNPDVSDVFGGARTECMIHYISDGYAEGRKSL
jgi:hypothetical protein